MAPDCLVVIVIGDIHSVDEQHPEEVGRRMPAVADMTIAVVAIAKGHEVILLGEPACAVRKNVVTGQIDVVRPARPQRRQV
jgi:hypothetical protein